MIDRTREQASNPTEAQGQMENTVNQGAGPAPFAGPSISLPKGGGAIRGMGEKFAANPVTGAGSMTVPITVSPGRSGFGPQLSLFYDSGAGNGPFGLGWNLSLPAITRKTDKGLPKYQDADESDIFILSGAEDLVPVFKKDAAGQWALDANGKHVIHEEPRDGFLIRFYRPRIEGLFARIERWTDAATGEAHWRSITKDNITTWYGKSRESRITDPDPNRQNHIFSWLICESYDDRGNAVLYRYKHDDSVGVNLAQSNEQNRTDSVRKTNQYLKRIQYCNRTPRQPDEDLTKRTDWLMEVVFDYGEHDANVPMPNDPGDWLCRDDPFSSYRSGFEVRAYRLCRRALMFHHFEGEEGVGGSCLTRSTDFTYGANHIASFITSVTQSGYKREGNGYSKRSLPPVEFIYSDAVIENKVRELDAESLENLPNGMDGSNYRWIDLDGDGAAGILTEQADAWFYKRNLSPKTIVLEDNVARTVAKFAPLENVPVQPSFNGISGGGMQFLDLAGDGRPDLAQFDGPVPGFYEHEEGDTWTPHRPFTSLPNINWRDPNLKFIDLTGDGRSDILITEDDVFTWYPSLAEAGFGASERAHQSSDEEKGPRLVFADSEQSIFLADFSGDGLTDLARIRNGEVCYWPNLGYGRFGAKVTMDGSPWFDRPDQFDRRRIRLADIDGSGVTDIIYLHGDGVRLYFNQSGNSWSEAKDLNIFPETDHLSSVMAVDLLGNGTACLAWSSPLPGRARRPMFYVDLMGGQKPHLMISSKNNLGAETRVQYAPSTKFYLQDKYAGKPWVTRLPFPVHVVERVETFDHISRNRFVTRYAYHHGYFDGVEREFRGFGMVEQLDTEEFAVLSESGALAETTNLDAASHVPPVRTKTWFHTGIYLGREHVSDYFAGLLNGADHGEYFREPGLSDAEARGLLLPDTTLPAGLTLEEEREACRALKGSMLRQEVYADDTGPNASADQIQRARMPYTVTEQNFSIRALQPRGANRHAVFFIHAREAISYHYERNPADPRIQHALTLEVDDYGNTLKQAAIGYGRRAQIRVVDALGNSQLAPNPGLAGLHAADQARQTTPLITFTENRVTNAIESHDTHRNPLSCEALTFELTGYTPTGPADRFQASDFVEPDPDAVGRLLHKFIGPEVTYEATAMGNQRRRPIEQLRTLYRRDDLGGLLPLGDLEPLALPGESYKLAFTPGLLAQVFQRPRQGQPPEALLPDPAAVLGGQAGNQGAYVQSQALKADGRFPASDADNHWWIPSGRSFFTTNPADNAATELAQARQRFFLPRRYRDPFGQDAFVDFDAYDLLMVETRDALGNRVTVEANDYRVLQPRLVSDPNRNRTEVAFDTLGMVVGSAVMGKPLPAPVEGDTLTGFVAEITQAQIDSLIDAANPNVNTITLLQGATTRIVYDLDRFRRTEQANPNNPTMWQPACAATLARETHVSAPLPPPGLKIQFSISYSDGFGREIQKKIQAEPGRVVDGGPVVDPRWVGSGWTIFNNKGKPVRQYEPFFSATIRFEFGLTVGVSPVLFYDPAERVIAKLHPNHTYEKAVFTPWQKTTYDVNDSCAPRNAQTGDPRTDPDIGGYVAEYFKTQPATWQTWREQRSGGALGPQEQEAAIRAAAHADTPTTAHLDALGRSFLTVSRNRVVCPGHDLDGAEDSFVNRVELDVEGNQRAVRDAIQQAGDPLGRIVMRYDYDMLGSCIHQLSMEAGARWMLNDVSGKPIRAWDSRGHNFTSSYDAMRRPVEQTVRGVITNGDDASDPRTLNRDILFDKTEYGEGVANAESHNLRGRIYRRFDSAGVAINARLDANGAPVEAYDFKGNLLHSARRLVSDYKTIPNWLLSPQLDDETFEGSTRYDALNRPIQSIAPHSSLTRAQRPNKFNVIQPAYNEANLLERVDVWLERASVPSGLIDPNIEAPAPAGVANIDYDAKGQRQRIDYKNGASAFYDYDPLTFRLTRLLTRRNSVTFPNDCPQPPPAGWPGCQAQNLHYVYDPAGNITHIQDDAQQTIYFRNKRVEPSNDYVYDALYRLIQAGGREHLGQLASGEQNPPTAPDGFNAFHTRLDHPNDGNAMGTYIERYVYDAVGNFLKMRHQGSDPAHPGWTRAYDFAETSLIEGGKQSNRLSRTTLNPNGANPAQTEIYQHDAHGNMVRMPHLGVGAVGPNMSWDYKDQLLQTDRGGGGVAFYVYDASGQRVRKVWEKSPGLTEERIYLGGFEFFRKHGGPIGANTATLERETLHVMDDMRRIALVETRTLDTAGDDQAPRRLIRYQFGNHLGSTTLELDDQAEIISYEEYTPYGSTSYQAARSQTETPNRYRYTAIERDEESGFGYHGTRYSAYWLGRWTSTDRAGLIDGNNLYRYSRNNPIRFHDPNGTDPPTRASRYSLGEFRLEIAHPINDPLAHGAAYDLAIPGLFGLGATALNLGARLTDNPVGQGFINTGEFLLTGLLFYGPTVYSHEWGGHVGALERYGVSAEVKEFAWFSGSAGPTTPGGGAGLSVDQNAAVDAAGMNQQSINASVTYSRIARFGYYTPQDAVALFLGQAGTPAYAIRSLTRPPRPPNTDGDDINNYGGAPNSWSAEGIATASTLTALPAVAGLIYSAVQFIGYNRRSVEVPSLHFGSSGRLTFPNTQTLLTSSGAVLGASTVLSLGNDRPSFQLGIDVRPTSDFALALSARAYGLRFGGGRIEINPYLRVTAARSPGIFVGGELRLNPFPWLGITGAIEGGVNDIRAEPEALPAGSTGGVRGRVGTVFSF